MTPTTKATEVLIAVYPDINGRVHLRELAVAIEREAAAQERKRIRAAVIAEGQSDDWPREYLYALQAILAILAEPSE